MASVTMNAPMTGRIIEVNTSEGDPVAVGDMLVVIESMKMENEVFSQHAGTLSKLLIENDQSISEGDPMLEIETA
ncbi:MAG: acetyl-CoA carboxylase biotin carboxyl carrier protein subunit [SAR202 cluster bacterium]|nr:acetyl-CoA carboxylase biotin carboxyl carrier protein subunit [SAR202 cluster bacterium]MDP6714777.1 acetyl-CoA carboxylase biotin carboxyl carrier protein subunit [SAR202 cluster bacterium]